MVGQSAVALRPVYFPTGADEAAEGEPAKATERQALLAGLPPLDLNERVEALAIEWVARGILPPAAGRDAFHLAAGVHRMDFLLPGIVGTSRTHSIQDRLQACFSAGKIHFPVICTPEHSVAMKTNPPSAEPAKNTDVVLAEVRRAKAKLLQRFGHDLSAMARDAHTRQGQSGHPIKR